MQSINQSILNKENGTFTPLIFSCNRGMSSETRKFFNVCLWLYLKSMIKTLAKTSARVKRKLGFSLIRTAVVCLKGSRSRQDKVPIGETGDLDTRNMSSIEN